MTLREWIPPEGHDVLARNGYARVTDLDDRGYNLIIQAMEGFQAEFLALTRPLWACDFPIPGDSLSHFSRQWEYPYAWANLARTCGRLLDAGSGITFFPFLLSVAGFNVECCDVDESLGLQERYQRATALTGCSLRFTNCSLANLPYPDATFDAGVCISVLEHTGPTQTAIIRALARVIRPGGRLILTCDLDLRRDGGLLLEDLSVVLAEVFQFFDPVFPLDLRRPRELLTSETFLASAPWRLPWPWRPPVRSQPTPHEYGTSNTHFRSIAVLGITASRRAEK